MSFTGEVLGQHVRVGSPNPSCRSDPALGICDTNFPASGGETEAETSSLQRD